MSDPYLKTTAIKTLVNNILSNYTLELIAPIVVATKGNTTGLINFTITNTEGDLNIRLEKNDGSDWTPVNITAPTQAPYSYTVTANGTYRISV